MPINEYIIKRFLLEFIIFTHFGYVFPRSVPSANQKPTPQFEHEFKSSLALHPFYYDHLNSQSYRFHEPIGTFYDSKRGILRSFPGGGVPVLVDHRKRCSSNFVGIKPHPNQRQYYYVCKPDCVIFGKCQNLQSFDATKAQCIPYSTPDYTPVCTKPGTFPVLTDCTIYYRCDAQLKPRIYSCPQNTIFSPHNKKCICGARCNPTKVSPHGSHIPQDSEHKFPPCLQNGTFRTPTDCALYYTCAKQQGALYLQTRFKCPELEFFDPARGTCRPQHEVACDSIQLSELVFPRPPPIPHLPVIYPAHYSMDSLDDSEYPTEYSLSCSKEDTVSASASSSEGATSDSSAQTTKLAESSTILDTLTTDFPNHSITPKDASFLTISTSTVKMDSDQINTPTPSPFSTIGITSNAKLPTGIPEVLNFSTTILPTEIGDNSHSLELTSEDVSSESFPPKAFRTTKSIPADTSPPTTFSTDVISDPTRSTINFHSSNLQTGQSVSPIESSSTTSSIPRSSQPKRSTPLSFSRESTFITMLSNDVPTINAMLTSTAETTITPVASTSLTPSLSTGFSTSITTDRSFLKTTEDSSPLLNELHNISPNISPSSIGIVTTKTIPTFSFPLHIFFPTTTLSPLDSTTGEQTTVHSNSPFVETSAQTFNSTATDPSMSPPSTSNVREAKTTISPTTELLPTKGSTVDTAPILTNFPSTRPIEVTKENKVISIVSSLFSPEKTRNTITNTLNHNEIRSIRSSSSSGSVTPERAFEKEVNTENNLNEFENLGYYHEYESGGKGTESTIDKSVQNEVFDDNIKPLNISSLITNSGTDNNTEIKGTEGTMYDSDDSRFSNDVSCYEDNLDHFEVSSLGTLYGPRAETLPTTQSTSLQLVINPLSTRSSKRDAPNYNFQLHNQSIKTTAFKQSLIGPNALNILNEENSLLKYSTSTENISGSSKADNYLKSNQARPNDKMLSSITSTNILNFENSIDKPFAAAARSATEGIKCGIQNFENSTKIRSNENELGTNTNIAMATPFSQTVSSTRTDNNFINRNVTHLHVEDSMSTMKSFEIKIANQRSATFVQSSTGSNLSDLSNTSPTAGNVTAVSRNEELGNSEDSLILKKISWKNQSNIKPIDSRKNEQVLPKVKEKMLTQKQNKNFEEFSKSHDKERTNVRAESATGVHKTVDLDNSTFTKNTINNIDENIIIDSELQISTENYSKAKESEELTSLSKIICTVNGRDDTDIPQIASKEQIKTYDYSNDHSTSSENKMIIKESSPEALFTVKTDIEVEKMTEASPKITDSEIVLTEKFHNQHHYTPGDTQMKPLTTPTSTIVNHTAFYEQEAKANATMSSSTEVNLTLPDKIPSSGAPQLKQIVELNNTNLIDDYNSKFQVIIPSTVRPLRHVIIENNGSFKKADKISKLVDILVTPHRQKLSQKYERVEKRINFSLDRNLGYTTTLSTLNVMPNPKESIVNHFKSTSIDLMKSAEPENYFDSFENSTGLIRINDPFQNNNSNKPDKQINRQSPNSKCDKSRLLSPRLPPVRTNVICKTCTSDLPLSSSKIFTTKLSQSTTTQNSIITKKEEFVQNTTVLPTHLDIKFQDNFVNIESNDLRVARNVPNTNINTIQDTPVTYKGIYRTQTPVPNSNSETVTEFHTTDVPKLEVVVFGNLDLTVLYCPKDCSKQHEHKYDKKVFGDQHVVGIQWDPAMSKKTMSIQTV